MCSLDTPRDPAGGVSGSASTLDPTCADPGQPHAFHNLDNDVGQSRRALIAASSMLARATTRMILGAQSGYASGRTTVGCGGQTMRTIAGMLFGSPKSTARRSWLTWADASGVMDDRARRNLQFRLGPGEQ